MRNAVRVELSRVTPDEARRFQEAAGGDLARAADGRWFISEATRREIDNRISRPLLKAGAFDSEPYLMVEPSPDAEQVASARTELFIKAGDRLLIKTADLERLSTEQLKLLRGSDVHGLINLALVFAVAIVFIFIFGFAQHMLLERSGQYMMHTIPAEAVRPFAQPFPGLPLREPGGQAGHPAHQ